MLDTYSGFLQEMIDLEILALSWELESRFPCWQRLNAAGIKEAYGSSVRPRNVSVLNTQASSFDLIDQMKSGISLMEWVNVSSGRHVSDSISFNEAGAQWLLKEKKTDINAWW